MVDADNCVLAIDLGGGGPKVAVVSARGEFLARTSRSIATHYLPRGGAEQDPEEWWQTITSGVREVLESPTVDRTRIAAVSCTAQWSVTVPVDERGQHLMRAVHWTDTRGAPYTKALTGGLIKVQGYGLRRLLTWLRYTGGAPTHSGADVLAHILYIKHEQPEVYQQTRAFLEPADYINLRLTGRVAASQGTIFPYLLTDNRDNRNIAYQESLLRFAGIQREKLPELIPVGSVLGPLCVAVANEWGLNPQTPVVAATSDSQAAVLGSGAVEDFRGHLSVGTSSWLTCHVPFKKTDLGRFVATMPSAVRGRNMVVAEQGLAGKLLELLVERWLRAAADGTRQPAHADAYVELQRGAERVAPGSDGLLFLPWLRGAGPPAADDAARGGFLNQSINTDAAHAFRAVMEGVAYNLRWLNGAVERFIGRPFAEINFIGGGARSSLWCQILADVLDRPIKQVADPTWAIVRGAAFAGLMALEKICLGDIPGLVEIAETYSPTPSNRRIYDEMFATFLATYRTNRKLFARFSRLGET